MEPEGQKDYVTQRYTAMKWAEPRFTSFKSHALASQENILLKPSATGEIIEGEN